MHPAAHRFLDHTSEVELHLEAPTLPELFAEGAKALAELYAPGGSAGEGDGVQVHLESSDPEALLVDWLNELIYRTETRGCIFPRVEILSLGDRELLARLQGERVSELKLWVKAATLHAVRILREPGRVSASVVLDV